jgi:hypothetical protein
VCPFFVYIGRIAFLPTLNPSHCRLRLAVMEDRVPVCTSIRALLPLCAFCNVCCRCKPGWCGCIKPPAEAPLAISSPRLTSGSNKGAVLASGGAVAGAGAGAGAGGGKLQAVSCYRIHNVLLTVLCTIVCL